MRLLEAVIRWLEHRYEKKIARFCLTHGGDFAIALPTQPRARSERRGVAPQVKQWMS